MTRFERVVVWAGGAAFVTSLSVCAWWYGVRLGRPAPTAGWNALAWDMGIFTVFALHHSLCARDPIKRWLTVVPPRLLRSVYVWTASLLLIGVCLVWQPIGGDVYDVGGVAVAGAACPIAGLPSTGTPLIFPIVQSENIDDELAAKGITAGNPILKRRDDSGELGGRIIRDKLWFYGSARERIDAAQVLGTFRPDGSPSVEDNRQWFTVGKISYQLSKSNRLVGFYQHSRKHLQTGGSVNILPEAGYDQFQASPVMKAEWQVVHGNSLVTSLQMGLWHWGAVYTGIGSHDSSKTFGSQGPATTDLGTLRQTGLAPNAGNLPGEKKYHSKGSLTWYRPDLFHGNHQFKSGFDYTDHDLSREWINRPESAGNYQLVFRNGVPFAVNTWNYPLKPHNVTHYLGIYGTDSWTVTRRLTIDLGVRYARDNGFIPEGCSENGQFSVAQCYPRVQFNVWNTFAPRIRFALDVTGDGRTVIKGGWGRFDQMRKQTPEITTANQINQRITQFLWHDNNNKLYEPGEVNLNPNGVDFVSITGTTNGVPNPNEKEPKLDEFSLAVERQLGQTFAVRVTGVYSNTNNAYKLANNLRPASVYTIPITNPDPGPDGRVGTADDPGTSVTYWDYPAQYRGLAFEQSTLINPPDARKKFKSFELALAKRPTNRWQYLVAYSGTKKDWRYPAGGSPSNIALDNPNAGFNVADNTYEWALKGYVSRHIALLL